MSSSKEQGEGDIGRITRQCGKRLTIYTRGESAGRINAIRKKLTAAVQ